MFRYLWDKDTDLFQIFSSFANLFLCKLNVQPPCGYALTIVILYQIIHNIFVLLCVDKVLRSGWSEWSSWTNCQVKDEWCRKDRFRLCLDAKSCHVHDKLEKQVSSCALANCRGE